jgi:4-hydroxy-3-methylbut-2-enyl diphosphate reductase
MKKIILAEHLGFCMGVKRAISISRKAASGNKKVTIFKEIVHNEAVVEKFRADGIGQSKSLESVVDGTLIIPAHGATPEVFKEAGDKGLKVIDATCPLVIRIHKIIDRLARDGYRILHFGDGDHDETIGIVGHAPTRVTVIAGLNDLEKVESGNGKMALTSQTTAPVNDFAKIESRAKEKFKNIEVFNTICHATSDRQAAIMKLAPMVDLMLVVGSSSSANSKRLCQISKTLCSRAYLINSAEDIKAEWFNESDGQIAVVGLSAGASTPDFLIKAAIERLREIGGEKVDVLYPPDDSDQKISVSQKF